LGSAGQPAPLVDASAMGGAEQRWMNGRGWNTAGEGTLKISCFPLSQTMVSSVHILPCHLQLHGVFHPDKMLRSPPLRCALEIKKP